MGARIEGLGRLLRRLRIMPGQINQARDEALDEWARELEATAKRLAPKRTGALENAIQARVNRGSGKAWVQVNGQPREYAYYVEKGTSKMTDQPFMGPAAQIHRRTGERALRRSVPRRLR